MNVNVDTATFCMSGTGHQGWGMHVNANAIMLLHCVTPSRLKLEKMYRKLETNEVAEDEKDEVTEDEKDEGAHHLVQVSRCLVSHSPLTHGSNSSTSTFCYVMFTKFVQNDCYSTRHVLTCHFICFAHLSVD